jgi:hypothetical protein
MKRRKKSQHPVDHGNQPTPHRRHQSDPAHPVAVPWALRRHLGRRLDPTQLNSATNSAPLCGTALEQRRPTEPDQPAGGCGGEAPHIGDSGGPPPEPALCASDRCHHRSPMSSPAPAGSQPGTAQVTVRDHEGLIGRRSSTLHSRPPSPPTTALARPVRSESSSTTCSASPCRLGRPAFERCPPPRRHAAADRRRCVIKTQGNLSALALPALDAEGNRPVL